MKTDNLIRMLATDVPEPNPGWRYSALVVGGIALSLLVMGMMLELRPDIEGAVRNPVFLAKLSVFFLLGAALLPLMAGVGRPAGKMPIFLPLVPLGWLLTAASLNAQGQSLDGIMANIAWQDGIWCFLFIPIIALPAFDLFCRALRLMAPVDLAYAGTIAGMAAGAWGAFAYALSCDHDNPLYLSVWYLGAVILCGLIGNSVGRRWLKW